MQSIKLWAIAAVAVAGCAQGSKAPASAASREPGALALTVSYTTLCQDGRGNSTCASIHYPQVCWTGTCTENCGAGEREFHVCAPGGERTDDPMAIHQTTAQRGLAAGTWSIDATTPSWTTQCSTQVDAQHEGSATVNSAWRTCS